MPYAAESSMTIKLALCFSFAAMSTLRTVCPSCAVMTSKDSNPFSCGIQRQFFSACRCGSDIIEWPRLRGLSVRRSSMSRLRRAIRYSSCRSESTSRRARSSRQPDEIQITLSRRVGQEHRVGGGVTREDILLLQLRCILKMIGLLSSD